jgi:MoxR-like ATPase
MSTETENSTLSSSLQDAAPADAAEIKAVAQEAGRFISNVEKVIVGKTQAVTLLTVALLSGGHVLLEDVPGLGKTLLAKAAARSLEATFRRIQFTPDLMPSDVTGINYYNPQTGGFELMPGPIVAGVVLADEINRATPRTQSCLLECMEERQVTIDNQTIALPPPFLVLATQNPVELEGTFPLPEAQLDRFLLRLQLGYPDQEQEQEILRRFERANPLESLESVLSAQRLAELAGVCRRVHAAPPVRDYLVKLVRATRQHPAIGLGASPRATQGLFSAARALAAVRGRRFVLPDDVKDLAGPVLAHRLIVGAEGRLRGTDKEAAIAQILEEIPAPVEQG